MILHGNQRGGGKELALHLLKDDNDHVEVTELRGFISEDLVSALNEIYALSRGTRAKQYLFSLSLNPPPDAQVSEQDFEDAINQVEKALELDNQPRAIVMHDKQGTNGHVRRHAHAVWSRINTEEMKAIQLSFTKRKLAEVSRELYIKHGWEMPRGFMRSKERDPKNFTMQQWQQARRVGKDPREVKTVLQECWAISDTQGAFQQALKERGYTLARGDRRGFVALDERCEPFSISKKWIGIDAKDIRQKLTDKDSLPSVEDARAQIAQEMQGRLSGFQQQQKAAVQTRLAEIEQKRKNLIAQHEAQRQALKADQDARWQSELKQRQGRFSKGLRNLLDRVTGRRRELEKQNEQETLRAYQRDQAEKDSLIFNQLEQRRQLQMRMERLKTFDQNRSDTLSKDIQQYKEVQAKKREVVDFQQKMQNRTHGLDRER